MLLRFEENPHLGFVDDRVFTQESETKIVHSVQLSRGGRDVWCQVEGLNEKGEIIPAQTCKVQDSGEGTCYLVFGGLWGLRLTDPAGHTWHDAFLLLPPTGDDLR